MALDIEVIIDGREDREKTLSRRSRFETLLFSLSSSNRLVGIFGSVVQPLTSDFHLPKRQRITDVHHDNEANNLGRTIEIMEWFLHWRSLRALTKRLKSI